MNILFFKSTDFIESYKGGSVGQSAGTSTPRFKFSKRKDSKRVNKLDISTPFAFQHVAQACPEGRVTIYEFSILSTNFTALSKTAYLYTVARVVSIMSRKTIQLPPRAPSALIKSSAPIPTVQPLG